VVFCGVLWCLWCVIRIQVFACEHSYEDVRLKSSGLCLYVCLPANIVIRIWRFRLLRYGGSYCKVLLDIRVISLNSDPYLNDFFG
jgi:hypothetical protein